MAIFNSLGSNYSSGFAWLSLFAVSSKQASNKLSQYLAKLYGGKVTLTYKGREALELALSISNLPTNSAVAMNGFSCYVVYRAIERAGYVPAFVDLAAGQLNFGVNELRATHSKTPNLKAVIMQNTLGYPADITEIEAYCRKHELVIIEDLAHSTGVSYSDGRSAGSVGDFTMLSFSQDKPLDVVAGGALIDRRTKPINIDRHMVMVSAWQRLKNRAYPFWTMLIRNGYDWKIGRILHHALKRLKWLAKPIHDDLEGVHAMSPVTANLLLNRMPGLKNEIIHRQSIAAIYMQHLPREQQIAEGEGSQPTYLRFPLIVNEPVELIDYLHTQGLYLGDRWYDAPIAPRRYVEKTTYPAGLCPRAEKLAKHIVNLPTHRYVDAKAAMRICDKIKQWQASKSNL